MDEPRIVGRDPELAAIDRFLGDTVAGSRVLLIEGEVGIGKTTLLDEAQARAGERGFTVLGARPIEAEIPLDFAGLADLLEPVAPEMLADLPAPQRRALAVARLEEDPGSRPADPRTIAMGTLTVLRRLAETAPVVISVDDIPWLDGASARVLSFALRRLDTETVRLVGAIRTDPSNEPTLTAVEGIPPDRIERVPVRGISLGAMRELLTSRAQFTVSRPSLVRLHEAAAGNPFFALEFAGVASTAGHDIADVLRVPPTLRRLVLQRLAPLPPGVRDVLLLCAVATDPSPQLVVRAAARPDQAIADLDQGLAAGAISMEGDRIRFVHPVVRSVVQGDAAAHERRAMHRRLAGVVDVPEHRDRHRALAADEPDEQAAAAAEAAARASWQRGGADAAADLGELAVRLTPVGGAAAHRRRSVQTAEYCFEASDPGRARSVLEAALPAFVPGPTRADALVRLAKFQRYCGARSEEWQPLLFEALSEAGDDAGVAAVVHRDLGFAAANAGDIADAANHAVAALELADRSGDQALAAQAAGWIALMRFYLGEGIHRDLVDRALGPAAETEHLAMEFRPNYVVAQMLSGADELDEARRLYEAEYERVADRGDDASLALLLAPLSETVAWIGEWELAEHLAEQGCEAAAWADSPGPTAFAMAARALVRAGRGQVDAARSDAVRAVELSRQSGLSLPGLYGRQVLGLLELSIGQPARAHEYLAPLTGMALAGLPGSAMLRFMPDEIEALVRMGELDRAETLLGPFQSGAKSGGRPSALAGAHRGRALLLAARGDEEGAATAIRLALEVHERLPMPLERGRTLLVAGEIHRRARRKRQAKDHLEEALSVFEGLGAPRWAERARDELSRVGLRSAPAATSELTDVERRVAELVAQGKTNAEVAAELFMGLRTVEAHLSRAYRKLGVRSRTGLAHALTRGDH